MHCPFSEVTEPLGQTHATLLYDDPESVTTQVWDAEHGLLTMQGLTQTLFMQVIFGGQSLSTLHSGTSAMIAKNKTFEPNCLICQST